MKGFLTDFDGNDSAAVVVVEEKTTVIETKA
jgi:hypothetical protein